MKKLLISFLAAMAIVPAAMAQDQEEQKPSAVEQLLVYENPVIYVSVGDINYKPQTTGQKVTNTVVGAVMSGDVAIEDETMVPMIKEAIASSASKALRFSMIQNEPTEAQVKSGTLKLTATITACNSTTRTRNNIPDKLIHVSAYVYLTDVSNGEVKASAQVVGECWASMFSTYAEANQTAVYNLGVNLVHQLNAWYPLRGHMLDKGFQKGKKQKLKEIYIDLGSGNHMGTGYDVYIYTVKRIAGRIARRFIGRGKITEVMGDDISSVQLKKGADLIKEAFDNGAEIAVAVH